MMLSHRRQLQIWAVLAVMLGVAFWSLGDVLLPFVLGAILAYCLDPLVSWLQRFGLGRTVATVVISLAVVLVGLLTLGLVVPLLVEQSIALIAALPGLTETLLARLIEQFPMLVDAETAMRRSVQTLSDAVRNNSSVITGLVLGSALNVLNVVLLIVLVPVVGFYLLLDWPTLIARVDALLPRQHAPVVRRLAREIDATIAAYIRGMMTVSLVMGLWYALGLILVGLEFGLVVGVIAGMVTIIPYVGALLGGALALGLALVQFWGDWVSIGLVAAVFLAGQAFEGNILTPNLVGKSVGLHPVWLILALAAFGALLGFLGLLIAVPLAAVIGVLARYLAGLYLDSPLYRGPGEGGDGAP